MSFNSLLKATGRDEEGETGEIRLSKTLKRLISDGQVLKTRRDSYGLTDKMDLREGLVLAHRDGFGFFRPDDGGRDWYLAPKHMREVLHNDRVLAAVIGTDRRGRPEAMIVGVLERVHDTIIGRVKRLRQITFVQPDETRLPQILIESIGIKDKLDDGDLVVVELTAQPSAQHPPMGTIVERLGEELNAHNASDIELRNAGIPVAFADEVMAAVKQLPDHVGKHEIKGRKDLRHKPLVTIDGADAKDFDDAVLVERTKGGFKLTVAIADVAYYVRPGQAIDDSAYERGTSVYFPDQVVPMLPEALSNGLCSLRPNEDRMAMVCEIRYDDKGSRRGSRFFNAVIRSHARLTYDEVWRYLGDRDRQQADKLGALVGPLEDAHRLFKLLLKKRKRRGALEFDSSEVTYAIDDQGVVTDVKPYHRNDAHRIIEEFMIAANVEAARLLDKVAIPTLFRVHAPPPEEKLEALRDTLGSLGFRLPPVDKVRPRDLGKVTREAVGRPDQALIQTLVLRSQSLAVYLPENQGHFGLALQAYSHFTSPIRRYPDLLMHRALKHHLDRGKPTNHRYDHKAMERAGKHCSMTERRAEQAERDVKDRLKAMYLARHVGDTFEGIVTGVTSFGVFVELDRTLIHGLIHVTQLPNDYYRYDERRLRLTGEKRGQQFTMGQRLRVRVERVDEEDRKIDFGLVKVLD